MAGTDGDSIFRIGLGRASANFAALTPLGFLPRAASIYPDRAAMIHGDRRIGYREFAERARRLASALARRGIGPGDTVSAVLPNVPAMLEAHFGVPMIGAVLNTINTRLDARTIAYILEHGEAKVLLTDREYAGVLGPALERLRRKPLVIEVDDALYEGPGERLGEVEYETFLATGAEDFVWTPPTDESAPITLNYTSGTTGNPKGVVYHHRDGGHARVPAPRRSAAGVPADRARAGDPHVRRADRAHAPDPDAARAADGVRAGGRARDRWLLAPRQGHPRHERDGLQRHPPLRAHRGARAVDSLRAAGGVGGPGARRARREGGAPGRALPDARRPDGGRSENAPAGAGRRAYDRRGPAAGQHRHAGLLEGSRGDGRGVRRRMVPHRRSRRAASRRLHGNQGPRQGHHHLGWREHLLDRGGDCPQPPSGGSHVGRGGPARREVGRDALRVRPAPPGRHGHRGGADPVLPGQPAALRDPQDRRVRRAADHLDRQGPEVHAARAGAGAMSVEFFRPPLEYPRIPYDRMLSHGAARHPENVAVIFRDVSLTYRELEALTNRFARALTALGVSRGDRVCLLTPNCPEYIIAFYAIARVGAIASPMNPSYREREIEYQLNDTEAVVIVTHTSLVPLVDAVRATPRLRH